MYLKKMIVPSLCVFTLIAISVGCKKSNTISNSSSISATMGSSNMSISGANESTWYSTDSSVFEMGGLYVNGKDTTVLAIQLVPPFTIGTPVTDWRSVSIDYYNYSTTADYYAGDGLGHFSLTVSSQDTINHRIVGTFSGTLYNGISGTDSMVVTNGKFNTAYSVVP
jgi:hypothetical protein